MTTTHIPAQIPYAADQPTMEIPVAGFLAYGMSRSRSYRAAKTGFLPTVQISENRFVVPTAKLREILGLDVLAGDQLGGH